MGPRKAVFIVLAAAVVILTMGMLQTAAAVDLIVEQNPTDPTHFASINNAITFANNIITTNVGTTVSYRVFVEPGSYPETISLVSNISVIGRETARTILTGGVSANSVTNVNLQHFTFINTSPAIVSNNSSVNITNNVFVGLSNAAIQVPSAQSTLMQVINNTFFQNGTAISADGQALTIENNIFSQNGTAISSGVLSTSTILNNAFFQNTVDGAKGTGFIPNGTTVTAQDPLFVNPVPAVRDFHLQAGSFCIDNGVNTITDKVDGTQSDIGAYGGPDEDMIPFPVANVTATVDSADPTTVNVSWAANNDYQVVNGGGYRIWYGTSPGARNGTSDNPDANSPVTLVGTETTFPLSGLKQITAVVPVVPVQNQPQVQNESLVISWSTSSGATEYKVYYSPYSITPPNCFDAGSLPDTVVTVGGGDTSSYTLTGLTNGQKYCVAVSAVSQAAYYVTVTAFDSKGTTTNSSVVPGQSHESAFSPEVPVGSGSVQESTISEVKNEFPEALIPIPNLPNTRQGCFIATAAYGHYSAAQVQALRKFRDKYLLTNRAGSAFVRWYYVNGPRGAAWLEAHPSFKPLVRAALLPAVGFSLFMTETAPAFRAGVFILAFLIIAASVYLRKRLLRHGGLR